MTGDLAVAAAFGFCAVVVICLTVLVALALGRVASLNSELLAAALSKDPDVARLRPARRIVRQPAADPMASFEADIADTLAGMGDAPERPRVPIGLDGD